MFGANKPTHYIEKVSENTRTRFTTNMYDLRYKNNGSGRDSYIADNNGGFSVSNTKLRTIQHGSMHMHTDRRSVSPKGASVNDTMRPIHYNTNGTGRDTYINTNNGGFTGQQTGSNFDSRVTFKNNLRDYKPNHDYLRNRKQSSQVIRAELPQAMDEYLSSYQQQMNHIQSPVKDKSNLIHLANLSVTLNDHQKSSSPLSREMLKSTIDDDTRYQVKNEGRRYATRIKNRVHVNSNLPYMSKLALLEVAPPMPHNMTQRDSNKIANYLHNMTQRLSIPKMTSVDSQKQLTTYLEKLNFSNSKRSQEKVEPVNLISGPRLPKLQPTQPTPNVFYCNRNSTTNMPHEKLLKYIGSITSIGGQNTGVSGVSKASPNLASSPALNIASTTRLMDTINN